MSYQTRRSQGQWSSVRSYSTYGNVISNYAQALQQVQETSDNVELQKAVMAYKNGTATYQDVVNLVNARLGAAIPNSQRELDLREVLLGLEDYETNKNRDIKRAELKAKYAKGGISAQEELQIQKEMLRFYKEGTADYSEQLSNIATATELANQEVKNSKLAELQAKLSEGGLTPDEEIDLYKQGKDMAEPGSAEAATFDQKINEAKQKKEQQDIEQEANQKYLELLDKYKDGGITDEENLNITRELLNIYKPGSSEYTQMKEAEAKLLGDISKGSGAGAKAEKQQAQVQFQALEAAFAEQQQKINEGVNPRQALEEQFNILQQQQQLAETYGDVAPDQGLGNLQANLQRVAELKNQIDTGQAVIVRKGGKDALVPLSELGNAARFGEDAVLGQLDKKGNPKDFIGGARVLTIVDDNGDEKKVIVQPNGQFEEVSPIGESTDGKGIYQRTGKLLDYGTRNQTKVSLPSPTSTGDVLGASTINTSNVTKAPNQTKVPKPTSSSASSKSNVSSSSVSKAISTAGKVISTVNQVKSAIQQSGPSAGAYGGTGKVLSAGIKPGNIKGTIDIGVTEAISSAAKKAVSSAKNILGSLFKKK